MKAQPITIYLPDTRGVSLSPYGRGNAKIGPSVFTYSRIAGKYGLSGTCPGSTLYCEAECYAKRIEGVVRSQYVDNSVTDAVPPIPDECRLLRIHVSGDFSSPEYIMNWIERLVARPDVTAWAYTRSWRVPYLLPVLEQLQAMRNMTLWASIDRETDIPPAGWRIAGIDDDDRYGPYPNPAFRRFQDGISLVCPEETGKVTNCETCKFCFSPGDKHLVFLKH